MSRPEKFSTASAEDLYEWALSGVEQRRNWQNTLATLRDEVAREVREECAAAIYKAQSDADAWMERFQVATTRAERAEEQLKISRELMVAGDKVAMGYRAEIRDLKARAERADKDNREWERRHNTLEVKADALCMRAERAERERDSARAVSTILIDEKKQAEAALAAERAKTADAKRQGGYEALTKLIERIRLHEQPSPVYVINVEHFRDTHYAPPAPAGVTLGHPHNWRVTFVDGMYEAERIGRSYGIGGQRTAYELCRAIAYTPTDTELAALLRLADREGKGNG